MKNLKKIAVLALLLIGIFSFSKVEKIAPKTSLNLEQINIIKILSSQDLECRPSSDFLFYVETKLVKKSRGYSTINASIFVLDRVSGNSNLLANENIMVPFHKETVLKYDSEVSDSKNIVLSNGDKIIGSDAHTPYSFNELIKYEIINNSYNRATNQLLHINRTL